MATHIRRRHGQIYVTRHINPPPPNPPLEVILLLGPRNLAHPIGHHFAQAVGFKHLDVVSRLQELDASQDSSKMEQLHPLGLKRLFAESRFPPPLLLMPVLRAMIDGEVAQGGRKFVIAGMPGTLVNKFVREIASPSAMFLFYEAGDFWDVNRRGIEAEYEQAVLVPISGSVRATYSSILAMVYERGIVRGGDKILEAVDVSMTDDERPVRADSPMGMVVMANSAIPRK